MVPDQIKRTSEAVQEWLQPENRQLQDAIERTVDEGLFSFEDIKHQIRSLRRQITTEALQRWMGKVPQVRDPIEPLKTLCLHAGNLPLVGSQDIIACSLARVKYIGKLSRKDPYILATLIDKLIIHKALIDPFVTTDLDELKGFNPDQVLFSGGKASIKPIRDRLQSYGMRLDNSRFLARTAHYSIAYVESSGEEAMIQLTESIFRYGGKGCRSVAVLITPFLFQETICSFTDYVETFWLKNPQHEKPPASLYHRYAYNRAVGINQSWLDHFLIEETRMKPEQPFILHWIQGSQNTVEEFVNDYREGLQSIYCYSDEHILPKTIGGKSTEPLHQAQDPPIDWKPDDVDTLEWLLQPLNA